MPKFLLLLHQAPLRFDNLAPEDIQKIVNEYVAWREALVNRNRLLGGEKLRDGGGRHVRMVEGKVVSTDGPFSEAAEVLGGYFLIEAADVAEAEQIAISCPHLAGSRWIEVRQIEDVH